MSLPGPVQANPIPAVRHPRGPRHLGVHLCARTVQSRRWTTGSGRAASGGITGTARATAATGSARAFGHGVLSLVRPKARVPVPHMHSLAGWHTGKSNATGSGC